MKYQELGKYLSGPTQTKYKVKRAMYVLTFISELWRMGGCQMLFAEFNAGERFLKKQSETFP